MIPDYISVVLGNLAVVIGSSLFVFAICDFTDRETPIKTIIIIIVNYVLFFHFFPEPKYFAMRNIMHSFVGILLTLFAVYFLFRFSDTRFTSSKRFLIFLYLFSIVIIFFRALFLFHSESSLRFFDINIFNRVYFISVFFIPLITTFGFLLMLRQANTK
ncbi:MAG: hypothetical protein HUU45_13450 [Leptospiraceae bacterium]|nr:hypothetical protein [Leptospiraceae bacterium]